jgi:hypothetical protein
MTTAMTTADLRREALVRLPAQGATLTSLDLAWNGIGDAGAAAALADALHHNNTLTRLLGWNGIGEAAALRTNLTLTSCYLRSLTSLSLNDNVIGDVEAKALADQPACDRC